MTFSLKKHVRAALVVGCVALAVPLGVALAASNGATGDRSAVKPAAPSSGRTAAPAAFGIYLLTQGSPANSDSTQLTGAATTVESQFAVFNKAATPADTIPGEPTISGAVVRHIGSSSESTWASLANGFVCIQNAGGANVCLPPQDYKGKPLVMAPGRSNVPAELVGLAPDGITSVTAVFRDGTTAIGAVVDNGFTIQAGKTVKEIRWTTPDNVTHTQEW
ncbi:MAG TPA: hypothetical protein VIH71_10495 [Solirubrobacteraceae bacterium]